MVKQLIAINPGGIANRIKCLIPMLRISEKYNKKMYLYWVQNKTCGAPFDKLFDNKFWMINKESLYKLLKEDSIISETYRFITLNGEVSDGFAKVFPTKRGNNIDFEFDRIPISVRENILSYLNRLKPIKVIQSIVDKFTLKHNVKDLVGVHIRRGDFLGGKEGLGKVSSDNKFIEKMNDILKDDPSSKFFLCTDCQQTEDKFIEKFGNKIIIYPKKSLDRTSVMATQQSLVDMLLLSKTKHIIGTYISTFTELAWWFGGCKAKVDMIVDDDLKKQYEITREKFRKSKYQKFKKFVYKVLCGIRVFKG